MRYLMLLAVLAVGCSEPCSGSKEELQADYAIAMNNCGWSADCRAEVERQYEKRMENACD